MYMKRSCTIGRQICDKVFKPHHRPELGPCDRLSIFVLTTSFHRTQIYNSYE